MNQLFNFFEGSNEEICVRNQRKRFMVKCEETSLEGEGHVKTP